MIRYGCSFFVSILRLLVRFNKLKGKNHKYANAFILLEWVNFANVLFQFMLTNLFLHGRFWNYGWRLIDYYLYYEVFRLPN